MARVAGVCAIVLLASVLSYNPAPAEGASTHLKIKGKAALATFVATDPSDPCIETIVNISASEEIVKDSPGEKATMVEIHLIATQVNNCTGIPAFVGDGSATDPNPEPSPLGDGDRNSTGSRRGGQYPQIRCGFNLDSYGAGLARTPSRDFPGPGCGNLHQLTVPWGPRPCGGHGDDLRTRPELHARALDQRRAPEAEFGGRYHRSILQIA
jgi:hypothetical protein